jgi:hypothetical protein
MEMLNEFGGGNLECRTGIYLWKVPESVEDRPSDNLWTARHSAYHIIGET